MLQTPQPCGKHAAMHPTSTQLLDGRQHLGSDGRRRGRQEGQTGGADRRGRQKGRDERQTGALVVDWGVGDEMGAGALAGVLQHFGEAVAVGQLPLYDVDLQAPSSPLRFSVLRNSSQHAAPMM